MCVPSPQEIFIGTVNALAEAAPVATELLSGSRRSSCGWIHVPHDSPVYVPMQFTNLPMDIGIH